MHIFMLLKIVSLPHLNIIFMGEGANMCFISQCLVWYVARSKLSMHVCWMNERKLWMWQEVSCLVPAK